MDRFEVKAFTKFVDRLHNLHSSMDRFEEHCKTVMRLPNKNLHSSMDRFEAGCASLLQDFIDIYIPVWIDLKIHISSR